MLLYMIGALLGTMGKAGAATAQPTIPGRYAQPAQSFYGVSYTAAPAAAFSSAQTAALTARSRTMVRTGYSQSPFVSPVRSQGAFSATPGLQTYQQAQRPAIVRTTPTAPVISSTPSTPGGSPWASPSPSPTGRATRV